MSKAKAKPKSNEERLEIFIGFIGLELELDGWMDGQERRMGAEERGM
jgi:hypothetical protein